MTPFRIIGNVYFVGTYQASSHLIDTGDGLVLIDTGYEKTFYLVIDGIHRLGFDPKDVKYVINSHWHWDHTEGSAAMAATAFVTGLIALMVVSPLGFPHCLACAAIAAPVAAYVELIPHGGNDTVTVPVAVALCLLLIA